MQVRDTLVANPSLNGKKDIYISCVYEITSIGDKVGIGDTTFISLSNIDNKERLLFIDKTIYDMNSNDIYDGVRIYEVDDIEDIKDIPDQVRVIIEDFTVRKDKLISERLVKKWKKMKLKEQIADWVMAKLDDPATKEKVVNKWNTSVNIPILNEKTEEKIFGAIFDSVKDVIKDVLIK